MTKPRTLIPIRPPDYVASVERMIDQIIAGKQEYDWVLVLEEKPSALWPFIIAALPALDVMRVRVERATDGNAELINFPFQVPGIGLIIVQSADDGRVLAEAVRLAEASSAQQVETATVLCKMDDLENSSTPPTYIGWTMPDGELVFHADGGLFIRTLNERLSQRFRK